jgi:hypothetical protein
LVGRVRITRRLFELRPPQKPQLNGQPSWAGRLGRARIDLVVHEEAALHVVAVHDLGGLCKRYGAEHGKLTVARDQHVEQVFELFGGFGRTPERGAPELVLELHGSIRQRHVRAPEHQAQIVAHGAQALGDQRHGRQLRRGRGDADHGVRRLARIGLERVEIVGDAREIEQIHMHALALERGRHFEHAQAHEHALVQQERRGRDHQRDRPVELVEHRRQNFGRKIGDGCVQRQGHDDHLVRGKRFVHASMRQCNLEPP